MLNCLLVLLFFIPAVVNGRQCYSCYGNNQCGDSDSWMKIFCPNEERSCYKFISPDGRVYKMGCAFGSCIGAPGWQPGIQCQVCRSDLCNSGPLVQQTHTGRGFSRDSTGGSSDRLTYQEGTGGGSSGSSWGDSGTGGGSSDSDTLGYQEGTGGGSSGSSWGDSGTGGGSSDTLGYQEGTGGGSSGSSWGDSGTGGGSSDILGYQEGTGGGSSGSSWGDSGTGGGSSDTLGYQEGTGGGSSDRLNYKEGTGGGGSSDRLNYQEGLGASFSGGDLRPGFRGGGSDKLRSASTGVGSSGSSGRDKETDDGSSDKLDYKEGTGGSDTSGDSSWRKGAESTTVVSYISVIVTLLIVIFI